MTAYNWKPGLCGSGCGVCAAVRAAFEAGREYNDECYSMKAAMDKDYPPLPPWLPGAKEDK